MPENTAEGDPAVFFLCAIKNTKKLRRGAVLSCQRIRRSPKTVRTCAKRRTYFLFFLRIDVAAGGGTIDKTDRRGSVWM